MSRIRPFLSMPDAETLVHIFITSRLDYCNVLFSGLSSTDLKKKTAACLKHCSLDVNQNL
ncbi:hypothetical protein LDENG_00150730 [Lucifuga dentata]|nr:hypothetical protein LDENG_00150730 [Lucifuga dentata]